MARKKSAISPKPPQLTPVLSGSNSTPPQATPQAQPAQGAKPETPQPTQSVKLAPQGAQPSQK